MSMETATVTSKYIRISPRKARLAVNLIRGKKALEAQRLLSFAPQKSARLVLKSLQAAMAVAKEKNIPTAELLVKTAKVDGAPVLKRGLPVSRGRWHPILKRNSHITLVLEGSGVEKKTSRITKQEKKSQEEGKGLPEDNNGKEM